MIQTIKLRLHPTPSQERDLHEIYTIYNKVKRIGYKLFFGLKEIKIPKKEKRKIVQPQLMDICQNNPYVNSILIENEKMFAQQKTWLEKRKKYMKNQIDTITEKIEKIKQKDKKDR